VCGTEQLTTPKQRSEPSLERAERKQLADLLTEFSQAFSMDVNGLDWTNVVIHATDTGDSKPVKQPHRRHPPAHDDVIQKHVADKDLSSQPTAVVR